MTFGDWTDENEEDQYDDRCRVDWWAVLGVLMVCASAALVIWGIVGIVWG